MILASLCYIQHDGYMLTIHRVKRSDDIHLGKLSNTPWHSIHNQQQNYRKITILQFHFPADGCKVSNTTGGLSQGRADL
jgi:hypothetical protein